jgi:membrane-associated phospholipid phosphatase
MRILLTLAFGAALIYAILSPLGLLAQHHAARLDRQSYNWIGAHQVRPWTSVMHVLTQIGNPWTTWGAAGAAAACLAVSWRRTQWFPPLIIALLIVLDRVLTLALQHTVSQAGPPHADSNTWPSGGVARAIMFYGLIAFLLWRECGGGRRAGTWAAAFVAMLTFNEAYSRLYLNVHWLSDIPGGLLYGTLVLSLVVAVVGITDGPATPATVQLDFAQPDAAKEFAASTAVSPRRKAHAQHHAPAQQSTIYGASGRAGRG